VRKAYRNCPEKTKFTRHTARAARLAERASRQLTICSELVPNRPEAARLLRMADCLRAFAVSVEKVATLRAQVSHG